MSDELENVEEPLVSDEEPVAERLTPPDSEPDAAPETELVEAVTASAPLAGPVDDVMALTPETGIDASNATGSVSWVPFSAYLSLWVVLAVATFVVLRTSVAAEGALWVPEYAFSVYGGVALVVLGPVLALGAWLSARRKVEPGHRQGLLSSALLRAAGATFVGVVLWLVSLYALDLYRLGLHT